VNDLSGLTDWLHVQLDEDERAAKARRGIFPSPGVDDDGTVWLHVRPGGNAVLVRYRDPAEGWDDMAKLKNWADAEHGWTQERMLREIDAKRRILAGAIETRAWAIGESGAVAGPAVKLANATLRLLAAPYADRPGYREEWRP
jgi:hypothetical protein